jgi:hypothetical protein
LIASSEVDNAWITSTFLVLSMKPPWAWVNKYLFETLLSLVSIHSEVEIMGEFNFFKNYFFQYLLSSYPQYIRALVTSQSCSFLFVCLFVFVVVLMCGEWDLVVVLGSISFQPLLMVSLRQFFPQGVQILHGPKNPRSLSHFMSILSPC